MIPGPEVVMADRNKGLIGDGEFERQLLEMQKRGSMAVMSFTAREAHQICREHGRRRHWWKYEKRSA
jgi:hypothetical protein